MLKDLDISICKAQGILKTFINLGIVEAVRLGGKDRTPSIYSYVSSQNANSLGRNNNTVSNTVNSTYKKDLFQNNNKAVKSWTPQFDFD